MTTYAQIEEAERALSSLREQYLRESGWFRTSRTPGSVWMWFKEHGGQHFGTQSPADAAEIQHRIYDRRQEGWIDVTPKKFPSIKRMLDLAGGREFGSYWVPPWWSQKMNTVEVMLSHLGQSEEAHARFCREGAYWEDSRREQMRLPDQMRSEFLAGWERD